MPFLILRVDNSTHSPQPFLQPICHKENGLSGQNPSTSLSSSCQLTYSLSSFLPGSEEELSVLLSQTSHLTFLGLNPILPASPRPCSLVCIFIILLSLRATSSSPRIYPGLPPSEKRLPQIQLPYHVLSICSLPHFSVTLPPKHSGICHCHLLKCLPLRLAMTK